VPDGGKTLLLDMSGSINVLVSFFLLFCLQQLVVTVMTSVNVDGTIEPTEWVGMLIQRVESQGAQLL
jgi:hypothetical protein